MAYLLAWIACGVFAAIIAASKGRSFFAWLILGFFFGIFALLAAGFMPTREHGVIQEQERECPYCAEKIKAGAVVCRYCGHDVTPVPQEHHKDQLSYRCSAYK